MRRSWRTLFRLQALCRLPTTTHLHFSTTRWKKINVNGEGKKKRQKKKRATPFTRECNNMVTLSAVVPHERHAGRLVDRRCAMLVVVHVYSIRTLDMVKMYNGFLISSTKIEKQFHSKYFFSGYVSPLPAGGVLRKPVAAGVRPSGIWTEERACTASSDDVWYRQQNSNAGGLSDRSNFSNVFKRLQRRRGWFAPDSAFDTHQLTIYTRAHFHLHSQIGCNAIFTAQAGSRPSTKGLQILLASRVLKLYSYF